MCVSALPADGRLGFCAFRIKEWLENGGGSFLGLVESDLLGFGLRRFGRMPERPWGCGSGRGLFGLRGLLGGLCGTGRYEAVQFLERAMIIALAAVDDALEAFKGRGAFGESGAGAGGLEFGAVLDVGLGGVVPEFGFHVAQTAQAPFVVDERVDEETLSGIDGTVLIVSSAVSSARSSAVSSNMTWDSA
jgi:hypothetical protein